MCWAAAIEAAAVMIIAIGMRAPAGELRPFISERQERVAFSAADATAGMFPQKEDHKGEYKRQADREGKWYDGHRSGGQLFPPLRLRAGAAISMAR